MVFNCTFALHNTKSSIHVKSVDDHLFQRLTLHTLELIEDQYLGSIDSGVSLRHGQIATGKKKLIKWGILFSNTFFQTHFNAASDPISYNLQYRSEFKTHFLRLISVKYSDPNTEMSQN